MAARTDGRKIFCLAVVIISFCVCGKSVASEADPVNTADKKFLSILKDAVVHSKVAEIAGYIKYPLRITHGKSSEHTLRAEYVKTKKEFIARYDEIFTAKVKSAVINQKPEMLFKNWQGIMIGNGEIWCAEIPSGNDSTSYSILITSINLR